MARIILGLGVTLLLACGANRSTPELPASPDTITLKDGITTVIEALAAIDENPSDNHSGLMPAEVVVVFKVEAGRTTGSSRAAELQIADIVNIGGESASEVTASAGNTITITFKSIVFAEQNDLIGTRTPEELTETIETLLGDGWRVLIEQEP